jgi:Na+/H+-dicarboxylate symporter
MRNHIAMAAGLLAGLALGLAASVTGSPVLRAIADAVRPAGTLFLNLLQMVVIPLVAAALFTGVAGLGDVRRLGRLGGRTLGFFWGTTLVAIALGFVVGGLLLPLSDLAPEHQAKLRALAGAAPAVPPPAGAGFLVDLVPANPLRAAVEGKLLPLIVFVSILASAAAALPAERRAPLLALAEGATAALIRIVHWVLVLAPVGIFALVAPAVAQFGWDLVRAMLVYIAAVATGVTLLVALVFLPAARWLGRRPARPLLRAAVPPVLMGFSTTSSMAALPAMFDAAQGPLAVDRGVAAFVLPLGASIMRAGSALFQAVALLFVARLYGAPIGAGELVQAGAAVFLASLTVAAVPGGSVVSLIPAFTAMGIPLSGIPLLLGLDRIPDMFRTATNVAGDLTGAVVLAAVERPPPPPAPAAP